MRLSAFLSLPIFVSCYEYVTSPAPFYCYAGDSASYLEEVVCPARSCVTRLLPREDNKFAVELDCNPEGSVCHNFEDGTQISVCCVASRCNNAHAVVLKEEEKMNISHAAWLLAVEAEKLKLNRTDRLPNPLPNVGAGPEDDTTEAPEGRPRRGAGRPMAALFVTLHMIHTASSIAVLFSSSPKIATWLSGFVVDESINQRIPESSSRQGRTQAAFFAMRVAVALLLLAASFLPTEQKKKDLDDLESLLENIDEEQADDGKPVNKVEVKNPCEDHVCGWGKECVVTKKGEPICECITKCPELDGDPNDMVCANNNQTFSSLCELYRQRCLCKKGSKHCEKKTYAKVHLEYLGECKQLNECTDELMAQFPERMSDWLFQVMRELKKRRELHNMEWEELLQEAETDDEKRHVYPVIWKFCDLDTKPHDKAVSHHELIPITAPVIPMESCIKPFLEGCDADNDGNISIKEWGKCLGLKEGEIQERC